MSDWAAKLSRNPKPGSAIGGVASHGANTASEQKRAGEKYERDGTPSENERSGNEKQHHENGEKGETHENSESERAGEKYGAMAKQKKNPDSNGLRDDPRETYNQMEVLQFLHGRFERDMAEARRDKGHENTVVYRSLESASAWNTSSGGSKKGSDDDGFNLLRELNRSSVKPRKPF